MPRKIKVPKIVFQYANDPDSEANLQRAYNRIFDLARKEIIRKRQEEQKNEVDPSIQIILAK